MRLSERENSPETKLVYAAELILLLGVYSYERSCIIKPVKRRLWGNKPVSLSPHAKMLLGIGEMGSCSDKNKIHEDERINDALPFWLGVASVVFSLLHFYWSLHEIVNEAQTGWGHGTDLEMGMLVPWGIEILSIPLIVGEAFLIHYYRQNPVKKSVVRFNRISFACYLALIVIFQFFSVY